MKSVPILCEGPSCNAGQSAAARERALVRALATPTLETQAEADRHARSEVSKALALRPHTRTGLGRGGTILYACETCGHERVYGTSMWAHIY